METSMPIARRSNSSSSTKRCNDSIGFGLGWRGIGRECKCATMRVFTFRYLAAAAAAAARRMGMELKSGTRAFAGISGRVCKRGIWHRKNKKCEFTGSNTSSGVGWIFIRSCSGSAGCRPSAGPYMLLCAPLWCCTNYSNRMQMPLVHCACKDFSHRTE